MRISRCVEYLAQELLDEHLSQIIPAVVIDACNELDEGMDGATLSESEVKAAIEYLFDGDSGEVKHFQKFINQQVSCKQILAVSPRIHFLTRSQHCDSTLSASAWPDDFTICVGQNGADQLLV